MHLRDLNGTRSLVSVATTGGPATVLTDLVDATRIEVTPDSSTVVFTGDLGAGSGLYSVAISGGPVVELGTPGDTAFQISPDSQRVLWTIGTIDDPMIIRSIPTAGGAATDIPAGHGAEFVIHPDSDRVFFISADEAIDIGTPVYLSASPIDVADPSRVVADAVSSWPVHYWPSASMPVDPVRRVLYYYDDAGDTRGLMALDLDSDASRVLAPATLGPVYLGLSPARNYLEIGLNLSEPTPGYSLVSTETGQLFEAIRSGEGLSGPFSPDERFIVETVLTSSTNGPRTGTYLRTIGGGITPIPSAGPSTFTPDSRRVVFVFAADERYGVAIMSTAGGPATTAVRIAPGRLIKHPTITGSGERYLYLDAVSRDPYVFSGTVLRSLDIRPRCQGRLATIVGSGADDVLRGTPGRDIIDAGAGNDTIIGRGGNDLICAGGGRDTVRGGSGDDRVHGGAGADRLAGNRGNDRLFGGGGNDGLFGGGGPDRLFGQRGRDSLDGSRGRDLNDGGPGRDSCIRPSAGPRHRNCER